eukprot:ANDGO_04669.mRNA.1 hypothetical protein
MERILGNGSTAVPGQLPVSAADPVDSPTSLAFMGDSQSLLFSSPTLNRVMSLALTTGTVSPFAGGGTYGSKDGAAREAAFTAIEAMTYDPVNGVVYGAELDTGRVFFIKEQYVGSISAFESNVTTSHGIAACVQGNSEDTVLYVTDDHCVWKAVRSMQSGAFKTATEFFRTKNPHSELDGILVCAQSGIMVLCDSGKSCLLVVRLADGVLLGTVTHPQIVLPRKCLLLEETADYVCLVVSHLAASRAPETLDAEGNKGSATDPSVSALIVDVRSFSLKFHHPVAPASVLQSPYDLTYDVHSRRLYISDLDSHSVYATKVIPADIFELRLLNSVRANAAVSTKEPSLGPSLAAILKKLRGPRYRKHPTNEPFQLYVREEFSEFLWTEIRSWSTPPKLLALIVDLVGQLVGRDNLTWSEVRRTADFRLVVHELHPCHLADAQFRILKQQVRRLGAVGSSPMQASHKCVAILLRWLSSLEKACVYHFHQVAITKVVNLSSSRKKSGDSNLNPTENEERRRQFEAVWDARRAELMRFQEEYQSSCNSMAQEMDDLREENARLKAVMKQVMKLCETMQQIVLNTDELPP